MAASCGAAAHPSKGRSNTRRFAWLTGPPDGHLELTVHELADRLGEHQILLLAVWDRIEAVEPARSVGLVRLTAISREASGRFRRPNWMGVNTRFATRLMAKGTATSHGMSVIGGSAYFRLRAWVHTGSGGSLSRSTSHASGGKPPCRPRGRAQRTSRAWEWLLCRQEPGLRAA
jgi:hypothetical protein